MKFTSAEDICDSIIGLCPGDNSIYYGRDGCIHDGDDYRMKHEPYLTKKQRIEVADYMIKAWEEFKNKLQKKPNHK